MQIRLFVYGTLLPDQPGYLMMKPYLIDRSPGAVYGGLFAGDDYPFLVPGGRSLVYGEWFLLKREALPLLDEYEGYEGPGNPGNEYERIWISDASGKKEGWVYAVSSAKGLPRITSGSWVEHLQGSVKNIWEGETVHGA